MRSYVNRFNYEPHDPVTQPWISLELDGAGPDYVLSIQISDPIHFTNSYVTWWIQVSLDDYAGDNPTNDVLW
jgi:hypothetical protein